MFEREEQGRHESKGQVHRRRGLFTEEFSVGDVFEHLPGHTFLEAENARFSLMTLNTSSLHLDHHAAADTAFGRPLVNGLYVFALVVGVSVSELAEGTSIANLGFQDVRFPAPVFAGDTVYSRTTILGARSSTRRPGQGVVEFEHSGTNQDGVVVVVGKRAALMKLRPITPA